MAVLVTGASGLLGRAVAKSYLAAGEKVHLVGRDSARLRSLYGERAPVFVWEPAEEDFPEAALKDVRTAFHLMGEPVGGRWTKHKKARIVTSRVTSAQKLARALHGAPARLVSASSFGIYPGRHGEVYTEATRIEGQKQNFIQSTLRAWENAAFTAGGGDTHVTVIRFAMVCSPEGYPKKLVRLFQRAGGFIVGDGAQIVPIVDIDDAVAMLRWAAEGNAGEGIINCVSPKLPSSRQVAETIAARLGKTIRLQIPEWLARPILGGSSDYFLRSYDIRGARADSKGFIFRHTEPGEILARALAPY